MHTRQALPITGAAIFGFIIMVSDASSALAQETKLILPDEFQHAIDEHLDRFFEEQGMPGLCVGIVCGDELIYSRSLGVTNIESEHPVDERTLFQIGSTTKSFTATLIALLVAEERLAWDEPIERYLPDWLETPAWNGDSTAITLRLLANHRSGLPGRPPTLPAEQENGLTQAFSHFQLWRSIQTTEFEREPDTAFGYSNFGYAVAGFILEHSTGAPYSQLLQDRIFAPLGMEDSTITLMPRHMELVARPYRWDKTSQSPTLTMPQRMGALAPSGDVFSSIRDLVPYLAFHMGAPQATKQIPVDRRFINSMREGKPVSPESKLSYGLGWGTTDLSIGSIVFHDGGQDGYTAYIGFSPDDQVASIVLCNIGSTRAAVPVRTLGHSLLSSAVGVRRQTAEARSVRNNLP